PTPTPTPTPTPAPTPPPPSVGYTSASQLAHWWVPGWDLANLGRDFAASGGVDVASADRGISDKDVASGGSASAQIDLDGHSEALGNYELRPYGIANTWSVAAWLRPARLPGKGKLRYALDLNGMISKRSASRISLVLDAIGHLGVVVSDAAGSERAIATVGTIDPARLGSAWYHVVAVKSGTSSLSLYVNGALAASTNLGVPAQADVPRVVRIGTRVKGGLGTFWSGGIGSIGVWHSALARSEIAALYAGGSRAAAALR
ncbi:MAG TPA: LamG domain-containing protein, partial [Myxococcota bacterium]|nr:LamG domain-containing protein [Myxococcota bacterium]